MPLQPGSLPPSKQLEASQTSRGLPELLKDFRGWRRAGTPGRSSRSWRLPSGAAKKFAKRARLVQLAFGVAPVKPWQGARATCQHHLILNRARAARVVLRKQAAAQDHLKEVEPKPAGEPLGQPPLPFQVGLKKAARIAALARLKRVAEENPVVQEETTLKDSDREQPLEPALVLGPTRVHLALQMHSSRRSRPRWPPSGSAQFARLMAGSPALKQLRGEGAALPASPEHLVFTCDGEDSFKCLQAVPVESSEADGEGVRLALVTCSVATSTASEVLWEATVRANPIALRGNGDSLWAVAGDRGRLLIFDLCGAVVEWPLEIVLDSNIAFMGCRMGSTMRKLLCVTGGGVVHLWDFQDSSGGGAVSLLKVGLHTSLYRRHYGTCNVGYQDLPQSLRVVKASLSDAELPVLDLVNGNSFTYDLERQRWLRL